MGPGTIGMAATQINVFVNTVLATGEGTGAVSWLDFAFRLMYLPIGLFGVSIATAATPAISRMVAEQDFARIRSTLAHALGLMLFLNLPATIGLIVLARPIVAVIFEHGNFTAADTIATAAALQLYAIGLIGYSIVRIISPTFYAVGRSRIPVMVSAGSVLVNIALNVTLVRSPWLSRAGARHVDHRNRQRQRAAVPAAAGDSRHRRRAHRGVVRAGRRRLGGDGRGHVGRATRRCSARCPARR